MEALPFVGLGHSYLDKGISILGNQREFSTGGIGYTSFRGRLKELFQGQIIYLMGRIFRLLLIAKHYDLLVVIGDVVPVFAAWLSGKPAVSYLVAYSSHYEGHLRLPWPCASCLASKRYLGIYSRDELTADDLSVQLRRPIFFLGNPFMDPVFKSNQSLPEVTYRLGLIPGSRRPELEDNLLMILSVIELLPSAFLARAEISFDMALVSTLSDRDLELLVAEGNWYLKKSSSPSLTNQLVLGCLRINVHRNAFVDVLQNSDVLLCMAGTASEQAVGLAKPVLQLPGNGPQFTYAFAEAQRRLLGPTVFCAKGAMHDSRILHKTALLIIDLLEKSKNDQNLQRECRRQANLRLGQPGGSTHIAEAISNFLS